MAGCWESPTGIPVVICSSTPSLTDVQFRMGSMVVFTFFFGGTLVISSSVTIWERAFDPPCAYFLATVVG